MNKRAKFKQPLSGNNYINMKLSNGKKSILLILLILVIDQISKIWIKTHFVLGEEVYVTGWFRILFIENNGMAFGMELFSKIFLSLFRIVAVGAIGYLIYYFLKKKYPFGFIACMSLIFAGALGNIIDSTFYGLIFNDSYGQIASLFPEGGGYAPIFQGKVVDMLYFPIIETTLPDWFPFLGGRDFVFFSPIFNLADSAITVGVACLLIFYSKLLNEKSDKKATKQQTDTKE